MKPFQKRVVDEKTELDDRLEKLNAFITKPKFEVDADELHRLKNQASVMQTYSRILRQRIENFSV